MHGDACAPRFDYGHAIYIVISRYPNARQRNRDNILIRLHSLGKAFPQDPIGFVLRLGRALHTFGYSADRLEAVLTKCSERLGLKSQFFSTPTSISFHSANRKTSDLSNPRRTRRRKSGQIG